MLGSLLKQLAVAAGRAAAERVVSMIGRTLAPDDDESHPRTFRDNEHARAQERSAIAAGKILVDCQRCGAVVKAGDWRQHEARHLSGELATLPVAEAMERNARERGGESYAAASTTSGTARGAR